MQADENLLKSYTVNKALGVIFHIKAGINCKVNFLIKSKRVYIRKIFGAAQ